MGADPPDEAAHMRSTEISRQARGFGMERGVPL
jgi:hypothetical protein